MRKWTYLMLTMVVLGGTSIFLSACNTTAGAGRDVSAVGHGVTNAAQDTKDKM